MARELTVKQKRVLSTLEAYWVEHQVPPSIADLAKELGINKATAYEHLLALKKKGFLLHQERAGRTWRPREAIKDLGALIKIPILGRVSAGLPLLAAENIEDYVFCEQKSQNKDLFALRVQGESMIKAHIQHNDIVIAKRDATVYSNDIVVALIDGEDATVKRYDKKDHKILLKPENNNFSIQEYDESRVNILGKVVEIRRTID